MSEIFEGVEFELTEEEREFIEKILSGEEPLDVKPLNEQNIRILSIGLATFTISYLIGTLIIRIFNHMQ